MRRRTWIPFERPHSALDVVKLGTKPMGVQLHSQSSRIVVSFQNGDRTDLSQSNPANKFASFSMSVYGATMILDRSTVITAVPSVVIPNIGHPPASAINLSGLLYKIVTPYTPAAWKWALELANITESYPNLVHNLSHGSPIGNPPPITFTFIPDNLPSANINPNYISRLISEEVLAGRMDGPFSI